MDSLKFKALIQSVEVGNMTKAADKLGYTQAGLTHMMNRLEKEIGLTLLVRSKSGVSLTDSGTELLEYMEKFIQAGEALENAIESIKINKEKTLRIVSYPSITNHWLPQIMNNFKEINSATEIELNILEDLKQMYNSVLSGEMDMAFGSHNMAGRCDFIHLHDDPLYAVLPTGTKWDGGTVPLEYFESKPFFVPTYGIDFDILNLLDLYNVKPKMYQTSLDDATVVSMVSNGIGVSILPKLILDGLNTNVVSKPLETNPYRELGIIVRSKDSLPPVTRRFINCCKATVNKIESLE